MPLTSLTVPDPPAVTLIVTSPTPELGLTDTLDPLDIIFVTPLPVLVPVVAVALDKAPPATTSSLLYVKSKLDDEAMVALSYSNPY